MKKSILLLSVILLSVTGSFAQPKPNRDPGLTVVTWNIRNNNKGDEHNSWPYRKANAFKLLKEINPQIFGMQEVFKNQYDDVLEAMPGYAGFGAGREDGKEKGEYVPLFYKTERFVFVKGDNFWLSETPDKPGVLGWDAVCPRMVSWIVLIDKVSKDTLFVFNTHFDHIGKTARLESSKLIIHAADSLAGKHPVIITGDFNTPPSETPYQVFTTSGFSDSRAVSQEKPVGPEYTFTGFDVKQKPGDRIDYVYIRNMRPVKRYIVREDNANGFYFSDHLPVVVKF
ncbi:MAG: endonuclease/exonuclease/phosphatase family protein [Bacteroidales bacterium]|nr:endonuclease/exonuclease/phosphatase family protein [Bacteroidales bacterium]